MTFPTGLGAISLGTSTLGGLTSTFGAAQSGRAQSNQLMYQAGIAMLNRQIAQQNANYAYEQGEREATKYGQSARQQFGHIVAAEGASGLDVRSGSAKLVQDSQRLVTQMDLNTIRTNAAKTAYNYQVQGAMFGAQAGLDVMAARDVKSAARTNVMSSILGTASAVSSKWLQGQSLGMWNSGGQGSELDTLSLY